MIENKFFRTSPIDTDVDWRELKGSKEFFEDIMAKVPFNQVDELIEDFMLTIAKEYSSRIQASGLCEAGLKAELINKLMNKVDNRYKVSISEEELVYA